MRAIIKIVIIMGCPSISCARGWTIDDSGVCFGVALGWALGGVGRRMRHMQPFL